MASQSFRRGIPFSYITRKESCLNGDGLLPGLPQPVNSSPEGSGEPCDCGQIGREIRKKVAVMMQTVCCKKSLISCCIMGLVLVLMLHKAEYHVRYVTVMMNPRPVADFSNVKRLIPTIQNISLTTKRGPIIGIRRDPNPATNVSYDAFIGIPYAEEPIRFQLPVAKQNWTTPIVTQTDGSACPQPLDSSPFSPPSYSEDCLFINVFTPKDALLTPGQLPVMAYFYGSAFTFSSSSSLLYGPDFLIPQNVILVTMNYRLGANGLLTLGSKVAPGNLALHDTLLALQWIQDEISVFGGDPTRVTLFGQGAGSAMAQMHYLSPLSTEMFARVLAQSGSVLAKMVTVTPEEGTRRAKLLAQAVNCNTTEDDQTILTCLQNANISDIVNHQNITLPTDTRVAISNVPFLPVLDTNLMADRPFFKDSLDDLMKAATVRAKPLLTGFNTDEGMIKFQLDNSWREAEANMGAFIAVVSSHDVSGDRQTTLVNEIRSKYFPNTVDDNKVKDLIKIYTDIMFGYPSVEMTMYFSNITYGYLFAYNGPWAPTPALFSTYKITGVPHGAELNYLFYVTGGLQDLESCTLNKPNIDMRDKMVQWWTTFAKTGVPDADWPTVSNGSYLKIDSTTSIINATSFESQYYDFWTNISNRSSETTPESTAVSQAAQFSITSLLVAVWLLITAHICLS